ncbi:MAG: 6-bladed beta-propeller, partial [Gammaproteobacteria bacterium]|nr:6-bladed beta-propeller [Gammaproteobacteria bacterium]
MKAHKNHPGIFLALLLAGFCVESQALEILHFIEAPDYARVLQKAQGLKITDDGVVYVTSEEQGGLLKIVDGNIESHALSPATFKSSDLGGIDLLPDGRLVIVNQGSGQVGILDSELKSETLFSQSGSSVGELKDPRPVAVSVNRNIFVGDVKNQQISVFNHQGLFLYTIGKQGAGNDLLRPTHVAIDAAENVYVLEGPTRLSIFDLQGNLIERISAEDLKEFFGETPELSAMTTDLNGNLYLGDDVTNRITIYDWRNRKVLGQFGALGQSRSQYRKISQLSVNASGQIAILDTKNKKVEVFQLDQTEFASPVATDLLEFGAEVEASCESLAAFVDDQTLCIRPKNKGVVVLAADGSEVGKFAEQAKNPSAIHVGSQSVAVLDKNQLHAFDFDGKNLFSIGRYGTSAGGFKNPGDVFVRDDKYYVSDRGNNRIQVFSSDGQFLEEIKEQNDGERLFFEVGPIAVDSQENLYIADGSAAGMIQVINKNRKKIASIGVEGESIHKVTQFHGLDIDQQDRLYVLAGSEFNQYGVRIYQDFKPFKAFGAEGSNGTLAYFARASSISVLSGAKNSVYINDSKRQKHFRYDLLEFPDAAFGLNIAADRKAVNLVWSSSQSPLIENYEIEAANEKEGPWEAIASGSELRQTLSMDKAGSYAWFRIVSVSGHGLRAPASAPKQNYFQTIAALYEKGEFAQVVKLADKLLKIAPQNTDTRDLLGMSLYQLKDYTRAISEFKSLANHESYRHKAIRYQVQAYYQ